MKTVFVLFDSLNRLALGSYGGTAIATPNFDRFAQRSVTFDRHYVGSLPCMPARRDMHTGRLNFLHRHWGPLEPFDESFARILSNNRVYTHLISDHLHYFEDGGWGYANAFDSWDFIRGQEYDPIKALVAPPVDRLREKFDERHYPMGSLKDRTTVTRGSSDWTAWKKSRGAINQEFLKDEEDFPTARCFAAAFEFLDLNKGSDDWFLQLECFDPHEPFTAPGRFKDAYDAGYNGKILNWPLYEQNTNSKEEIAEIRGNYAALVAMCDEYFGKLLEYFDTYDLWFDTCLILSTDHGFLLSEHDWWGKNRTPYYEEISHIPLIVWHPDYRDQAGERRSGLTQTPDLMPTILETHNCDIPPSVTGVSLHPMLQTDTPVRENLILGMFAGPVCAIDGNSSLFLYPEDVSGENLNIYTLAFAHMTRSFDLSELRTGELVPPFDFTKNTPVMKIRLDPRNTQVGQDGQTFACIGTALFDLERDPGQTNPIDDTDTIERIKTGIVREFERHDTPAEIYKLFGLSSDETVQIETILEGGD